MRTIIECPGTRLKFNLLDPEDNPGTFSDDTVPKGEPGFNTRADADAESILPGPSRGINQSNMINRGTQFFGNTKKQSTPNKPNAAQQAGSQIAKQVTKQATKAGAEAAIGETAGALLGGPVGIAVAAALEGIALLFKNKTFKKLLSVLLLMLILMILTIGAVAAGQLNKLHFSINGNGGSLPQPITDPYLPAVASQSSGIILGDSIESLDYAVAGITKTLNQHPEEVADKTKATQLLQQISDLKSSIKANAFSAKYQAEAGFLKTYKDLVKQLYAAVWPGRTGAQQRVLALLNGDANHPPKIKLQTTGGCRPDRDLKGLGVTENLFNVIAAAANNTNVTVNCMITGHRKYVARPPSQGYPRCGSPSLLGKAGASESMHCLGRAVDFSPNGANESFLRAHQQALHIRYIGNEGNHLHVEVLP